jgi:hypothetical protein
MINENKDEVLWQIARKRASFKKHFASYLTTNILLWTIWLLTGRHNSFHNEIPWPAWVTVFWGFGILSDYFNSYHLNNPNAVEKEYQKLKQNQNSKL